MSYEPKVDTQIQTMDGNYSLCNHLLKLHYPATELLPPGKRPYLHVPKDAGYREQPQFGAYHLTNSSVDFFLMLPTEPALEAPETLDHEDNLDITECVSWLSSAPGVSSLSAVSFIGEDDIFTRFSLQTTWFTGEGKTMEQEKLFELSSWQWNLLQSYTTPNSKESWTALMNDLMIGASDCAVLHRRLRLDEYEMGFADHEESLWVLGWDEMPEITPNQLLANHLELVAYQEDFGVAYAPVISLHTYADSDNLRVRLPCNHESNISAGILKDLSREDCLTAHCATKSCGRQIMDLEDVRLLDLARERDERADWAIDQIDWERRDREVRNGSVTTRTTGKKLYHALKSALASMKAPGSATHAALDAKDFAETKIVKRHLRSILSFDNDIDWAPRTVLIELQQETSKALKAASPFEEMEVLLLMLPPAFEEFLCKWLTRAVNHAFPSSIDMSIEDVEASFAEVLNHIERVGLEEEKSYLDGNDEMEE